MMRSLGLSHFKAVPISPSKNATTQATSRQRSSAHMPRRRSASSTYFYYYNPTSEGEASTEVKKRQFSPSNLDNDGQQSTASMEVDKENKKREGPDSRTVVIAPEKEKQKICLVKRELEFLSEWNGKAYEVHSEAPSTAVSWLNRRDWAPDFRSAWLTAHQQFLEKEGESFVSNAQDEDAPMPPAEDQEQDADMRNVDETQDSTAELTQAIRCGMLKAQKSNWSSMTMPKTGSTAMIS